MQSGHLSSTSAAATPATEQPPWTIPISSADPIENRLKYNSSSIQVYDLMRRQGRQILGLSISLKAPCEGDTNANFQDLNLLVSFLQSPMSIATCIVCKIQSIALS